MKVIIWLGNPGKNYESTRHNVGFFMVDALRAEWGGTEWQDSHFSGVISTVHHAWEKLILLKPTTYMNLSGQSVASIVSYYKLDGAADIIVISDDIDMAFAKVRFRKEGSHGGQNGLRDIIEKLSTEKFARIKVGIGRHEHMSVSDWVLSRFQPAELEILKTTVYPIVRDTLIDWI